MSHESLSHEPSFMYRGRFIRFLNRTSGNYFETISKLSSQYAECRLGHCSSSISLAITRVNLAVYEMNSSEPLWMQRWSNAQTVADFTTSSGQTPKPKGHLTRSTVFVVAISRGPVLQIRLPENPYSAICTVVGRGCAESSRWTERGWKALFGGSVDGTDKARVAPACTSPW